MPIDNTRAAVSRGEVFRKNGQLEVVRRGHGAKSDDVLVPTSQDFAVLGNSVDPDFNTKFKDLGKVLYDRYMKKQYTSGDAISDATQQINDQNMNAAFTSLMQRQEIINNATGKSQQFKDPNETNFAQAANGAWVPRYAWGGGRRNRPMTAFPDYSGSWGVSPGGLLTMGLGGAGLTYFLSKLYAHYQRTGDFAGALKNIMPFSGVDSPIHPLGEARKSVWESLKEAGGGLWNRIGHWAGNSSEVLDQEHYAENQQDWKESSGDVGAPRYPSGHPNEGYPIIPPTQSYPKFGDQEAKTVSSGLKYDTARERYDGYPKTTPTIFEQDRLKAPGYIKGESKVAKKSGVAPFDYQTALTGYGPKIKVKGADGKETTKSLYHHTLEKYGPKPERKLLASYAPGAAQARLARALAEYPDMQHEPEYSGHKKYETKGGRWGKMIEAENSWLRSNKNIPLYRYPQNTVKVPKQISAGVHSELIPQAYQNMQNWRETPLNDPNSEAVRRLGRETMYDRGAAIQRDPEYGDKYRTAREAFDTNYRKAEDRGVLRYHDDVHKADNYIHASDEKLTSLNRFPAGLMQSPSFSNDRVLKRISRMPERDFEDMLLMYPNAYNNLIRKGRYASEENKNANLGNLQSLLDSYYSHPNRGQNTLPEKNTGKIVPNPDYEGFNREQLLGTWNTGDADKKIPGKYTPARYSEIGAPSETMILPRYHSTARFPEGIKTNEKVQAVRGHLNTISGMSANDWNYLHNTYPKEYERAVEAAHANHPEAEGFLNNLLGRFKDYTQKIASSYPGFPDSEKELGGDVTRTQADLDSANQTRIMGTPPNFKFPSGNYAGLKNDLEFQIAEDRYKMPKNIDSASGKELNMPKPNLGVQLPGSLLYSKNRRDSFGGVKPKNMLPQSTPYDYFQPSRYTPSVPNPIRPLKDLGMKRPDLSSLSDADQQYIKHLEQQYESNRWDNTSYPAGDIWNRDSDKRPDQRGNPTFLNPIADYTKRLHFNASHPNMLLEDPRINEPLTEKNQFRKLEDLGVKRPPLSTLAPAAQRMTDALERAYERGIGGDEVGDITYPYLGATNMAENPYTSADDAYINALMQGVSKPGVKTGKPIIAKAPREVPVTTPKASNIPLGRLNPAGRYNIKTPVGPEGYQKWGPIGQYNTRSKELEDMIATAPRNVQTSIEALEHNYHHGLVSTNSPTTAAHERHIIFPQDHELGGWQYPPELGTYINNLWQTTQKRYIPYSEAEGNEDVTQKIRSIKNLFQPGYQKPSFENMDAETQRMVKQLESRYQSGLPVHDNWAPSGNTWTQEQSNYWNTVFNAAQHLPTNPPAHRSGPNVAGFYNNPPRTAPGRLNIPEETRSTLESTLKPYLDTILKDRGLKPELGGLLNRGSKAKPGVETDFKPLNSYRGKGKFEKPKLSPDEVLSNKQHDINYGSPSVKNLLTPLGMERKNFNPETSANMGYSDLGEFNGKETQKGKSLRQIQAQNFREKLHGIYTPKPLEYDKQSYINENTPRYLRELSYPKRPEKTDPQYATNPAAYEPNLEYHLRSYPKQPSLRDPKYRFSNPTKYESDLANYLKYHKDGDSPVWNPNIDLTSLYKNPKTGGPTTGAHYPKLSSRVTASSLEDWYNKFGTPKNTADRGYIPSSWYDRTESAHGREEYIRQERPPELQPKSKEPRYLSGNDEGEDFLHEPAGTRARTMEDFYKLYPSLNHASTYKHDPFTAEQMLFKNLPNDTSIDLTQPGPLPAGTGEMQFDPNYEIKDLNTFPFINQTPSTQGFQGKRLGNLPFHKTAKEIGAGRQAIDALMNAFMYNKDMSEADEALISSPSTFKQGLSSHEMFDINNLIRQYNIDKSERNKGVPQTPLQLRQTVLRHTSGDFKNSIGQARHKQMIESLFGNNIVGPSTPGNASTIPTKPTLPQTAQAFYEELENLEGGDNANNRDLAPLLENLRHRATQLTDVNAKKNALQTIERAYKENETLQKGFNKIRSDAAYRPTDTSIPKGIARKPGDQQFAERNKQFTKREWKPAEKKLEYLPNTQGTHRPGTFGASTGLTPLTLSMPTRKFYPKAPWSKAIPGSKGLDPFFEASWKEKPYANLSQETRDMRGFRESELGHVTIPGNPERWREFREKMEDVKNYSKQFDVLRGSKDLTPKPTYPIKNQNGIGVLLDQFGKPILNEKQHLQSLAYYTRKNMLEQRYNDDPFNLGKYLRKGEDAALSEANREWQHLAKQHDETLAQLRTDHTVAGIRANMREWPANKLESITAVNNSTPSVNTLRGTPQARQQVQDQLDAIKQIVASENRLPAQQIQALSDAITRADAYPQYHDQWRKYLTDLGKISQQRDTVVRGSMISSTPDPYFEFSKHSSTTGANQYSSPAQNLLVPTQQGQYFGDYRILNEHANALQKHLVNIQEDPVNGTTYSMLPANAAKVSELLQSYEDAITDSEKRQSVTPPNAGMPGKYHIQPYDYTGYKNQAAAVREWLNSVKFNNKPNQLQYTDTRFHPDYPIPNDPAVMRNLRITDRERMVQNTQGWINQPSRDYTPELSPQQQQQRLIGHVPGLANLPTESKWDPILNRPQRYSIYGTRREATGAGQARGRLTTHQPYDNTPYTQNEPPSYLDMLKTSFAQKFPIQQTLDELSNKIRNTNPFDVNGNRVHNTNPSDEVGAKYHASIMLNALHAGDLNAYQQQKQNLEDEYKLMERIHGPNHPESTPNAFLKDLINRFDNEQTSVYDQRYDMLAARKDFSKLSHTIPSMPGERQRGRVTEPAYPYTSAKGVTYGNKQEYVRHLIDKTRGGLLNPQSPRNILGLGNTYSDPLARRVGQAEEWLRDNPLAPAPQIPPSGGGGGGRPGGGTPPGGGNLPPAGGPQPGILPGATPNQQSGIQPGITPNQQGGGANIAQTPAAQQQIPAAPAAPALPDYFQSLQPNTKPWMQGRRASLSRFTGQLINRPQVAQQPPLQQQQQQPTPQISPQPSLSQLPIQPLQQPTPQISPQPSLNQLPNLQNPPVQQPLMATRVRPGGIIQQVPISTGNRNTTTLPLPPSQTQGAPMAPVNTQIQQQQSPQVSSQAPAANQAPIGPTQQAPQGGGTPFPSNYQQLYQPYAYLSTANWGAQTNSPFRTALHNVVNNMEQLNAAHASGNLQGVHDAIQRHQGFYNTINNTPVPQGGPVPNYYNKYTDPLPAVNQYFNSAQNWLNSQNFTPNAGAQSQISVPAGGNNVPTNAWGGLVNRYMSGGYRVPAYADAVTTPPLIDTNMSVATPNAETVQPATTAATVGANPIVDAIKEEEEKKKLLLAMQTAQQTAGGTTAPSTTASDVKPITPESAAKVLTKEDTAKPITPESAAKELIKEDATKALTKEEEQKALVDKITGVNGASQAMTDEQTKLLKREADATEHLGKVEELYQELLANVNKNSQTAYESQNQMSQMMMDLVGKQSDAASLRDQLMQKSTAEQLANNRALLDEIRSGSGAEKQRLLQEAEKARVSALGENTATMGSGIASVIAGLLDKPGMNDIPEMVGHYIRPQLNPARAAVLQQMAQAAPNTDRMLAEINANTAALLRESAHQKDPAVRAQMRAEAMAQKNKAIMDVLKAGDQQRSSINEKFSQILGQMGSEDSRAMMDATKYNADVAGNVEKWGRERTLMAHKMQREWMSKLLNDAQRAGVGAAGAFANIQGMPAAVESAFAEAKQEKIDKKTNTGETSDEEKRKAKKKIKDSVKKPIPEIVQQQQEQQAQIQQQQQEQQQLQQQQQQVAAAFGAYISRFYRGGQQFRRPMLNR